MHPGAIALLFAVLPLAWTALLVAVWHTGTFSLLLPAAFGTLLYPACFGYAAIRLLQHAPRQRKLQWLGSANIPLIAVLSAGIGYACSLYATGAVLSLIPEIYKFGGSGVTLSRPTVRIWALLTGLSVLAALVVRYSAHSSSWAYRLGSATLGVAAFTIIIFIPFVLSGYVAWRG